MGTDLFQKSQGIHNGIVAPYREAKSVSSENTFNENVADITFLKAELVRLTEKICLNYDKMEKVASCVAIKMRFSDFETITRQTTIPFTCADDEIIPVVKALFAKVYKKGHTDKIAGSKT